MPRHTVWILIATILASSLGYIEGFVTNVALADIGRDFHGSASDLQWTVNAYLLPLTALMLLGGAAGDYLGRRCMLVAGLALFGFGSIGCALAPGFSALVLSRAVQGFGAALLLPNSLGILGATFEGDARGRAIGTWAAAGAISSAIAPPIGGWLIELFGWRGIFLINLPIVAVAIVIALVFIEENEKGIRQLDGAGAVLATLMLSAMTWALTRWSSGHQAKPEVWAGLLVAVLLLAWFLIVERRKKDGAMMPFTLFASREFVGLTLITFLLYMALAGLIVLMPYLLIVNGGHTALYAGMALLPVSIGIGLLSRLMGRLADRIGFKWPLAIGSIVTGIGYSLFQYTDPGESYFIGILPAMSLISLGMGAVVAPLTTAVLTSVDVMHTGTASGFNSAIARSGMLIAVELAGAVIARSNAQLIASFHVAAIVAALLAFASGGIAIFMLKTSIRQIE